MKLALLDFVETRLASMLHTPDAWGPPHAVELQVLLMLETWLVVNGAPADQVEGVTRRWDRFLAERLPGPPLPLALRLGLDDDASSEFVKVLTAFVHAEQADHARRAIVADAAPPRFGLADSAEPRHYAEA